MRGPNRRKSEGTACSRGTTIRTSITVATAACYDDPRERAVALGPICRTVIRHSIPFAAFMGVVVILQADVLIWPWMTPARAGVYDARRAR